MTQGLLFDLDGTLLDTAPDFEHCLNTMLEDRGSPRLPLSQIRQVVSKGAMGLLELGFQLSPNDPDFAPHQQKLFELYMDTLGQKTQFFPGIEALLKTLEEQNIPWGIVTNKSERFTFPLLKKIFNQELGCVVCGDTLEYAKPHPAPVQLACERLKLTPETSLFVGDDLRDVQAGQAAGIPCCVVNYGYIQGSDDPKRWNAQYYVDHAHEIYPILSRLIS